MTREKVGVKLKPTEETFTPSLGIYPSLSSYNGEFPHLLVLLCSNYALSLPALCSLLFTIIFKASET